MSPAVTQDAIARHRASSRPSLLRSIAPTQDRPFGPRSLRVIALLESGTSRLEAAREVGLDKANVRVIELRARRRGVLAGVETRVEPTAVSSVLIADVPTPGPSVRDRVAEVLRVHPDWTNEEIAASVGADPSSAWLARRRLGIAPNPRGRRPGMRPAGDEDESRAARIRMAKAAGRTLADIGAEHGISRERVRQILKRAA